MNDTDNTQDRGLTTEQIAAAGTWTGQEELPRPAGHQGFDDDDAGRIAAGPAASGHGDGGAAAGPGAQASLLEDGELQSITMRWKDIQADFVDEPKQAIQEADALARLRPGSATSRAARRSDHRGIDRAHRARRARRQHMAEPGRLPGPAASASAAQAIDGAAATAPALCRGRGWRRQ